MKRRILTVALTFGMLLWGFSVWAANGDLIVNGKIGVGTTTPTTKLDVSGDIKVGSTTTTCNTSTEGAIHYNSTNKMMEFCNGTAWLPIGLGSTTATCGTTTEGLIHYNSTIKMMEFCNGTAWLPIGLAVLQYASQYPPAYSGTYVKATSSNQSAYNATDPSKSLTGGMSGNCWASSMYTTTNQRFHIDLGSAKVIKRIYYENYHDNGGTTSGGAKDFTLWGSNDAGAFANMTYSLDADPNGTWSWTQLTTSQTSFNQHIGSNVADPNYILLTNTSSYRYYAFKFANNYGSSLGVGVRRIELQTENGWQ